VAWLKPKRAIPDEWTKFAIATKVAKKMRDKETKELLNYLLELLGSEVIGT